MHADICPRCGGLFGAQRAHISDDWPDLAFCSATCAAEYKPTMVPVWCWLGAEPEGPPFLGFDDGTTTHSGPAPLFTFEIMRRIVENLRQHGANGAYNADTDTWTLGWSDSPPDHTPGEWIEIDHRKAKLYRLGYSTAWTWTLAPYDTRSPDGTTATP